MSFWKYISIKSYTIWKPINLFALQINWPVSVRQKSPPKSISEHTPQYAHKYISVKSIPEWIQVIVPNVINWLDFIWYELTLKVIPEQAILRGHLLVGLLLAQLFNSHWQNYLTVPGMILQHSLTQFCISHWHNCSTVAVRIIQQSLAQFFNSHWHECSTVAGKIVQQSVAWLINSHWHNSSTVTGMVI